MSLCCGGCIEVIVKGFGMLYRLQKKGGVWIFPDKARDIVPVNSAVCDACWNKIPKEEKLTGVQVKKEMEYGSDSIYLYLSADSGRGVSGSASSSSIVADETDLTFVRLPSLYRELPTVLEIIDHNEEEKLLMDVYFANKVRNYLIKHTPTLRVIEMFEFAEGMIAVLDDYNSCAAGGEFDVYFDTRRWKPTNPELWGGVDGLQKPAMKEWSIGVLEGIGNVPSPVNFDQLLAFAKRSLTQSNERPSALGQRPDADWLLTPRPVRVWPKLRSARLPSAAVRR